MELLSLPICVCHDSVSSSEVTTSLMVIRSVNTTPLYAKAFGREHCPLGRI